MNTNRQKIRWLNYLPASFESKILLSIVKICQNALKVAKSNIISPIIYLFLWVLESTLVIQMPDLVLA